MTLSQIFFGYFATMMTVLSLLVVTRKNPVHSVLLMLFLFVHIAGLELFLNAEFLAAMEAESGREAAAEHLPRDNDTEYMERQDDGRYQVKHDIVDGPGAGRVLFRVDQDDRGPAQ